MCGNSCARGYQRVSSFPLTGGRTAPIPTEEPSGVTEGNGRSGGSRRARGETIGVACRFPGARDPAEFHELTVTRRRMFQPAAALPGRPLRAALLDDWIRPPDTHGNYLGQAQPDPGQLDVARSDMARSDMARSDMAQLDLGKLDPGPLLKLATEMAALALTDAGLREVAWGSSRTGLIIASSVPGLSDLVCRRPARAGLERAVPAGGEHVLAARGGGRSRRLAGPPDRPLRSPGRRTRPWTGFGWRCRPGRARWAPTRCACMRPTRPGCCPATAAAW